MKWWRYPTRGFSIDGLDSVVKSTARTDGLHSSLEMLGMVQATDVTPLLGTQAVRNHDLRATLPDGRNLHVELGYMGAWTTGIVAHLDGVPIFESHEGRVPSYPDKYRPAATEYGDVSIRTALGKAAKEGWQDGAGTESSENGIFAKRNRLPFAIDVITGLLFYFIAKFTDLQTAALVGILVGFGLVLFQQITKIDVTGGLALFGIVMLCISAGLAWWLADDEWIKLRGTVTGLIAASFFIVDGLRGGSYIGKGLARYMPYSDIDPGRFAIAMGCIGLIMAALNYAAAKLLSTDNWLFYKTFIDIFIMLGLVMIAFRFIRKPRSA